MTTPGPINAFQITDAAIVDHRWLVLQDDEGERTAAVRLADVTAWVVERSLVDIVADGIHYRIVARSDGALVAQVDALLSEALMTDA